MSLRAFIRPIVIATSLLAGLRQSVDALAHGFAHSHEAEHFEAVTRADEHEQQHHQHQQHDHHQQHQQHQQHPKHRQDRYHEQHQEPTHHEAPRRPTEQALSALVPSDHQHNHVHAIVDAGLKSRADLLPFLVSALPDLSLAAIVAVGHHTPPAAVPAPPPARRSTSASPRAPPLR